MIIHLRVQANEVKTSVYDVVTYIHRYLTRSYLIEVESVDIDQLIIHQPVNLAYHLDRFASLFSGIAVVVTIRWIKNMIDSLSIGLEVYCGHSN